MIAPSNSFLFDTSFITSCEQEAAIAVLRLQHKLLPFLQVKQSSLGPDVGLGLFTTQDIDIQEGGGFLCQFFGKIVVSTSEEVGFYFMQFPHVSEEGVGGWKQLFVNAWSGCRCLRT